MVSCHQSIYNSLWSYVASRLIRCISPVIEQKSSQIKTGHSSTEWCSCWCIIQFMSLKWTQGWFIWNHEDQGHRFPKGSCERKRHFGCDYVHLEGQICTEWTKTANTVWPSRYQCLWKHESSEVLAISDECSLWWLQKGLDIWKLWNQEAMLGWTIVSSHQFSKWCHIKRFHEQQHSEEFCKDSLGQEILISIVTQWLRLPGLY